MVNQIIGHILSAPITDINNHKIFCIEALGNMCYYTLLGYTNKRKFMKGIIQ
jgi:hypothetical protein